MNLWNRYHATLRVDRLVAGVPSNPNLIQAWLDAKRPAPTEEQVAYARAASGGQLDVPDNIEVDVIEMLDRAGLDPEMTHTCIFYRDARGRPCLEGRCLKAGFKEAANVLGSSGKRDGLLPVVNMRAKLAERVFVPAHTVVLENPEAPGGLATIQVFEKPISVMTRQGPRTSIKRAEFTTDAVLRFQFQILRDDLITEEHVRTLFDYMSVGGIGSDRSQGAGTFELIEMKELH